MWSRGQRRGRFEDWRSWKWGAARTLQTPIRSGLVAHATKKGGSEDPPASVKGDFQEVCIKSGQGDFLAGFEGIGVEAGVGGGDGFPLFGVAEFFAGDFVEGVALLHGVAAAGNRRGCGRGGERGGLLYGLDGGDRLNLLRRGVVGLGRGGGDVQDGGANRAAVCGLRVGGSATAREGGEG